MRSFQVLALLGCALVTMSCGGGSGSADPFREFQALADDDVAIVEVIDPEGCVVTGLTVASTLTAGDVGDCDRREYRVVSFGILGIPVDAEIIDAAVSFDVTGGEGSYQAIDMRLYHASADYDAAGGDVTSIFLGVGPPPSSFAFSPNLVVPSDGVVAAGLEHWIEHALQTSDRIQVAVGPGPASPANGATDSLDVENFRLIVRYRAPGAAP